MGILAETSFLLSSLRARGAKFAFVNGKLRVEAPSGTITPAQLDALRNRKGEIAILLSEQNPRPGCPGAGVCAGCYEVAPGVSLHPPQATSEWQAWLRKWQPHKAVLQ